LILFKLFGPGDPTCSAAPAYTSPTQNVSGDGTYTSPSFTPTASGTYSWQALYSGDAQNSAVTTTCGDTAETVTVAAGPAAPSCALTGVIAGPPKQIQITAQDTGSGLQSIVTTEASNTSVSIPPFAVGTTASVVVTATKVDQTASSTVTLQITDVAGLVTNCDPAVLNVGIQPGVPRTQTVHHVSKGESVLTIYNGTPGLTQLALVVDGKRIDVTGLKDGEQRKLDVSRLMHRGSNTVSIIAQGKSGGSATVLLTS
jgi:hypothetical protein